MSTQAAVAAGYSGRECSQASRESNVGSESIRGRSRKRRACSWIAYVQSQSNWIAKLAPSCLQTAPWQLLQLDGAKSRSNLPCRCAPHCVDESLETAEAG